MDDDNVCETIQSVYDEVLNLFKKRKVDATIGMLVGFRIASRASTWLELPDEFVHETMQEYRKEYRKLMDEQGNI